jgi:outer membrane protein
MNADPRTRFLSAAILVSALALLLPAAAAAADRPLGVIDSQRIADEYDAARDAQEQYQKFLRELELEVSDREKELTGMAEEIESQKMLLGEDALKTKIQDFERKRADYFQFREGIDQRAEQEYNAKMKPILDQIKTIVERIGKEKGYGLIIDSSGLGVVYIDSDFDLTDEVLTALARGDE